MVNILGKQVLPLLRRNTISATESDRRNGGMGSYLTGEKRRIHYRNTVTQAEKDRLKLNKEQDWFVFAINADGKYDLRSQYGYTQENVSRSDFRLIKNGKTW